MSNLGMYQKMTTASKKVGGPQNFLAITALCGYCTLRFGEHLIKAGLKKLKTHNQYIRYETESADCPSKVFLYKAFLYSWHYPIQIYPS